MTARRCLYRRWHRAGRLCARCSARLDGTLAPLRRARWRLRARRVGRFVGALAALVAGYAAFCFALLTL